MSINLGDEISRRRREQKLTQEDLAELSELLSQLYFSFRKNEKPKISIQKLDSIARALNTTTPDIINNAYRFKKVRIVENYDSTSPLLFKKSSMN